MRASDPALDRLRIVLDREPAVRLAYLFGSRASGRAGPRSDWDVAAVLRGCEGWEALALADRIQSALGGPVDLIDLAGAPIELAARVVSEGLLVLERSAAERVEFEARTLSLAHDMSPLLERVRREILEDRPHDRAVERHRATLGAARGVRGPT
jgi:predicted nucleotidyltransferase